MCVPAVVVAASAAVVSAVSSVASIGVSVAASNQQAKAAKARGEYENKVAMYEALAAKNAGRVEQIKQGIAQRREFGRQRLMRSALDVDISYGSQARSLEQTRKFHAFDSSILARNVQARVLGARMRGEAALYNSRVDRNNAQWSGVAGAVRGVNSLAGSINSFVNSGVLDLSFAPSDSPTERRLGDYSGDTDALIAAGELHP